MPELLLLRHAKSDWSDPGLDDFDRPLNGRGRKAAPAMGRYLRQQGLLPDLVLCSAARRAQQTWKLVSLELGTETSVRVLRSLYMAGPKRLVATLREVPDDLGRVLLVGHNPGMEDLAAQLAEGGQRSGLTLMAQKFPTAALAVLDLGNRHWSQIGPGSTRLERFIRPRDLE